MKARVMRSVVFGFVFFGMSALAANAAQHSLSGRIASCAVMGNPVYQLIGLYCVEAGPPPISLWTIEADEVGDIFPDAAGHADSPAHAEESGPSLFVATAGEQAEAQAAEPVVSRPPAESEESARQSHVLDDRFLEVEVRQHESSRHDLLLVGNDVKTNRVVIK